MTVEGLNLKKINLARVRPAAYNPRKDLQPGDPEYDALRRSLEEFGCVEPLIWNKRTGNLVGGHQRLKVLQAQGITEAEVVVVDLDEGREKQLNIALNKISGEWDFPKLADVLEEIKGLDLDVTLTGFSEEEIAELLAEYNEPVGGLTDPDEIPETVEPITQLGDLWLMGEHRLLCGDSTKTGDVEKLMAGRLSDCVFTSPPYNVGIQYSAHNDKMNELDYERLIRAAIDQCYKNMSEGRIIAWNVGVSPKSRPYYHALWLEESGFIFYRHIVWKKTSAQVPLWQNSKNKPAARHYLPNYNHELIYMASKGGVSIGGPTSMPDLLSMDVWDICQFTAGGHAHPAAFPVALATAVINVLTAPMELIHEPFVGSGTIFVAAEQSVRICYGMEIDPHYCDVAVQRWEKFTGRKAEHAPL